MTSSVFALIACGGDVERGVFDQRSATNTVIAGETQTAVAAVTATANAELRDARATIAAGPVFPSGTATPTVDPDIRVPMARPTRVLPTIELPPGPDETDSPTDGTELEPTPEPTEPEVEPTPEETPVEEPLLFLGPLSRPLEHLASGENAEEFRSGAEVANFLATATFSNPFASEEKDWSIGLWFRVTRDDGTFWTRGVPFPGIRNRGLMIVIESDNQWRLINRRTVIAPQGRNTTDTLIQQGVVSGLDVELQGENTLSVAAYGDRGSLIVNGIAIATLDLSTAVEAGDVVAVAGIEADDEFAGSFTRVTGFTVQEAGTATEASLEEDTADRLLAGTAQAAFTAIDGDFVADAEFPVVTPIFTGHWSWEIAVEGEDEVVRFSVGSDSVTKLEIETAHGDGSVQTVTPFESTLNLITIQPDEINSTQVLFLDGRLQFVINGFAIPGVDLDPDASYDISLRAFVRGETATSNPIVRVETLSLWQPVSEDEAA